MFVIADQSSLRIGGKRRLPRAGKAEEQRRVAILSLIRGAMHRQHALQRQRVIQNREDALLHFTGVLTAKDHHFARLEIDIDRGLARQAGYARARLRLAAVVDHPIRLAEICQFLLRRTNQHVPHEQRMVGTPANNADLQPMLRIPRRIAVNAIDVIPPRVQRDDGGVLQDREGLLADGDVDVPPPDVILGNGVLNDALVLRAAPSFLAGVGNQGPVVRDVVAGPLQRQVIDFRHAGVAINVLNGDAVLAKIKTH